MEGVIGSAFDDLIVGGAASEIFTGGAGSDVLVGGAGWDRAVIAGMVADYVISAAAGMLVTYRADGTTDTVSAIETLAFDDAEVNLANGAVAAGDVAQVREDGSVRIEVAQLLANDYGLRDLSLSVQGAGGAENGTVVLDGDAPVAGADALNAVEDTSLVIDPGSLLANDSDLDGNSLTVTEVSAARCR